ncbi:MAG: DUF5317 domain-containing protein [Candidatus Marsarchaeota archaeon]|nr:DUF5317 domain-containing protein [Candidatus Marsarchaeota archaeon]
MFLVIAVALGLVDGFIRRGKLTNLTQLPLRFGWIIFLSLFLQIAAFSPLLEKPLGSFVGPIFVLSELALLVTTALNIKIDGLELFFLGLLLNLVVLVANGGYMPITSEGLILSGRAEQAEALKSVAHLANSTLLTDQSRLPFLSDIIVLPSVVPLANVFSAGDVFIALGAFVAVRQGMLGKKLMVRRDAHNIGMTLSKPSEDDLSVDPN